MEEFQLALLIWSALWGPAAYSMIYQFYQKRDTFPIKQRWPNVVLFTMTFHLTCILMLNFVDVICAMYMPAFLDPLCLFTGATACAFLVLLRVWKFYFDYRSSHDRLSHVLDSWFLKKRAAGERSVLITVGAGIFVIYTIAAIAITSLHSTWNVRYSEVSTTSNGVVDDTNNIFLLSSLPIGALMVIFAFLLRNKEDGLHIKSEFRIAGLTILGVMIVYGILLICDVKTNVVALLLPNATCFIMINVQIAYPLALSHYFAMKRKLAEVNMSKYEEVSHNSTNEIHEDLPPETTKEDQRKWKIDKIMSDPQMLEELKVFLTKELSIENLLFLLDLEKFKASKDNIELERNAELLIQKFVMPQSPFELNLSSDTQGALKSKLQMIQCKNASGGVVGESVSAIVDLKTFKAAECEIKMLLETDPVRRFRIYIKQRPPTTTTGIAQKPEDRSKMPPVEVFQV
jgi:hypothetical protein